MGWLTSPCKILSHSLRSYIDSTDCFFRPIHTHFSFTLESTFFFFCIWLLEKIRCYKKTPKPQQHIVVQSSSPGICSHQTKASRSISLKTQRLEERKSRKQRDYVSDLRKKWSFKDRKQMLELHKKVSSLHIQHIYTDLANYPTTVWMVCLKICFQHLRKGWNPYYVLFETHEPEDLQTHLSLLNYNHIQQWLLSSTVALILGRRSQKWRKLCILKSNKPEFPKAEPKDN